MKKIYIVLLFFLALHNVIVADEVVGYYEIEEVEIINKPLLVLLDSFITHEQRVLKKDRNCMSYSDTVTYKLYINKSQYWPNEPRLLMQIVTDNSASYVYGIDTISYLSNIKANGSLYRINIRTWNLNQINWREYLFNLFFTPTGKTFIQIRKRFDNMEEMMKYTFDDDGASEIMFIYEDDMFYYFKGNFCNGEILVPQIILP